MISYEPFAGNFARLRANVGARKNIEPVRAAVAGRSGALRLYHPRSERLSGVYSTHADFGERSDHMSETYDEVPAVSLAELFERHAIERCDLLKIDVEGAEYDILYSAPRELLGRVERIHGEYHDVERDDPRSRIERFTAFLEDAGYEVDVKPHRRKPNHGMFFAARRAS